MSGTESETSTGGLFGSIFVEGEKLEDAVWVELYTASKTRNNNSFVKRIEVSDGKYQFENIAMGEYYLKVIRDSILVGESSINIPTFNIVSEDIVTLPIIKTTFSIPILDDWGSDLTIQNLFLDNGYIVTNVPPMDSSGSLQDPQNSCFYTATFTDKSGQNIYISLLENGVEKIINASLVKSANSGYIIEPSDSVFHITTHKSSKIDEKGEEILYKESLYKKSPLIAHYTLDGHANDVSGNNLHGVAYSNVVWLSEGIVLGQPDRDIALYSSSLWDFTRSFTLEATVEFNPSALRSNVSAFIEQRDSSTDNISFSFGFSQADDKVFFRLGSKNGVEDTLLIDYSKGRQQKFSAVYNATNNKMLCYRDDILIKEKSVQVSPLLKLLGQGPKLGDFDYGAIDDIVGTLYDIKIYNTALSYPPPKTEGSEEEI